MDIWANKEMLFLTRLKVYEIKTENFVNFINLNQVHKKTQTAKLLNYVTETEHIAELC